MLGLLPERVDDDIYFPFSAQKGGFYGKWHTNNQLVHNSKKKSLPFLLLHMQSVTRLHEFITAVKTRIPNINIIIVQYIVHATSAMFALKLAARSLIDIDQFLVRTLQFTISIFKFEKRMTSLKILIFDLLDYQSQVGLDCKYIFAYQCILLRKIAIFDPTFMI